MADYTKFKSGDPLTSITANLLNDAIDVINSGKITDPTGRPHPTARRSATTILVQNNTGQDLDAYKVVGLDTPIILPTDGENGFTKEIAFNLKQTAEDEAGRWCVLWEPIANGKTGIACLAGATIAKVNIQAADDTAVEADGSNLLKGGQSGSGILLWVAGGVGAASALGEQWAIVRIGGGSGGALPTGQYMGMDYMTTSQGQSGWSFPFFGAFIG